MCIPVKNRDYWQAVLRGSEPSADYFFPFSASLNMYLMAGL